jgi:type I restriction-modification system DNA methylase subunit
MFDKFFVQFETIRNDFKGTITGIKLIDDIDRFANLSLNRLIFCYFLQQKGFLDNNKNYLPNKLKYFSETISIGSNSFYKDFIVVLFRKGLRSSERNPKNKSLLGNVPFLNLPLFEVQEIELKYPNIAIPDESFRTIFKFFDRFSWKSTSSSVPGIYDISPNILGSIFEKGIDKKKEKGAFYTPNDITNYICKYTIIPFIFEEVKRLYPEPFLENGEISELLRNSCDKYIYCAIKYGIDENVISTSKWSNLFSDLPPDIILGLSTDQDPLWEIRKPWNKPAPSEIALRTENYREVIERRNRYKELSEKIATGEINNINDFISFNLDIESFSHDVIRKTKDQKLIEHFYKVLEKITILDPTCGSGDFLFAAIDILEPLFVLLLDRMGVTSTEKYFIIERIIRNNLYGLDIMHDSVEVAKKRLYLRLLSHLEPNTDIEKLGIVPFQNADYNIKTANYLNCDTSKIFPKTSGGFDIIIGNPPYIEYSTVPNANPLKYFKSFKCGNLYASCIERSLAIANKNSRFGMIVQAPILNTERMRPIQLILEKHQNWFATFDDRPTKLFNNMQHARMTIILSDLSNKNIKQFVTGYAKISDRKNLFEKDIIFLTEVKERFYSYCLVKSNSIVGGDILHKLSRLPLKLEALGGSGEVYFYSAPGNYVRSQRFHSKNLISLKIHKDHTAFVDCLLNSSLFFFFATANFFGRTGYALKASEIYQFPIPALRQNIDLTSESEMLDKIYLELLSNTSEYQPLTKYLSKSKPIIDVIDSKLADYFGFNQEELDFIVSFEGKFRERGV